MPNDVEGDDAAEQQDQQQLQDQQLQQQQSAADAAEMQALTDQVEQRLKSPQSTVYMGCDRGDVWLLTSSRCETRSAV